MPRSPRRSVRRRPFGVRLYLAVAFASVALIALGLAYLLVSDSTELVADDELTQLALGRTDSLADEIGARPRGRGRGDARGHPRRGLLGLGLRFARRR